MVRDHSVPTGRLGASAWHLTAEATDRVCAAQTPICGGGRESNPPTDSRRRTGFEDQEGHQAPVASGVRIPAGLGSRRRSEGPKRCISGRFGLSPPAAPGRPYRLTAILGTMRRDTTVATPFDLPAGLRGILPRDRKVWPPGRHHLRAVP